MTKGSATLGRGTDVNLLPWGGAPLVAATKPDATVALSITVETPPARGRRASLLLAPLLVLAIAGSAHAADPQFGPGIASSWGGPGVARHACVWPWTDCAPITITSLDTGRSYTVRPTMYCDCYVGRIGPRGETERIVDLDPAALAALGLPARFSEDDRGLYDVIVEPAAATLPNTAAAR